MVGNFLAGFPMSLSIICRSLFWETSELAEKC